MIYYAIVSVMIEDADEDMLQERLERIVEVVEPHGSITVDEWEEVVLEGDGKKDEQD